MTLYKLRSAAGLTELETEVHSGLEMDLPVIPVPWGYLWSGAASACPILAFLLDLPQGRMGISAR